MAGHTGYLTFATWPKQLAEGGNSMETSEANGNGVAKAPTCDNETNAAKETDNETSIKMEEV